MQVTCVCLERRVKPPRPGDKRTITMLILDVRDGDQLISLDITSQLYHVFGFIRDMKLRALVASLSPSVTLETKRHRNGTILQIVPNDIEYWVGLAQEIHRREQHLQISR